MLRYILLLILATPAFGEPVTWATPFDTTLEDFELCIGNSCNPIGFTRWHESDGEYGDSWRYIADVNLTPGIRARVRGITPDGYEEPVNPVRIWCSPWDLNADNVVGAPDLGRWMFGWFFGGAPGSIEEFGLGAGLMGRSCR